MRPLLVLILALALGAMPVTAHPVHVSSTQIDLAANRQSLAITLRVFTDDFEQALTKRGQPAVRLSALNATTADSLIAAYLDTRVRLSVDDAPMTSGRVTSHETDGEATLVHLVVPLRAVPHTLSIEQRVLLERFDDQNNIVHVTIGTRKRSALTRRGVERADFRF